MFQINYTTKFKKDFKVISKRKYDLQLLKQIIALLTETGMVPERYNPHKLKGIYNDSMECHILPDWLLIWIIDEQNNEIWLTRTGTHSDLF
jgi:mRNA interferase YafQ